MTTNIPPITPELWLANLLGVLDQIADTQRQELRWLATDAYAWENPNELLNSLLDDCVFEGFLEEYGPTFSNEQRTVFIALTKALNKFCDANPQVLDASEVLADPEWENIRERARAFISAFKDQWPTQI